MIRTPPPPPHPPKKKKKKKSPLFLQILAHFIFHRSPQMYQTTLEGEKSFYDNLRGNSFLCYQSSTSDCDAGTLHSPNPVLLPNLKTSQSRKALWLTRLITHGIKSGLSQTDHIKSSTPPPPPPPSSSYFFLFSSSPFFSSSSFFSVTFYFKFS